MRCWIVALLGLLLISLGFGALVWGHSPEGVTFLAFQWPPGHEPVIDGDLNEWEIVPDAYIVNTEQYTPGAMKHTVFTDVLNMEDEPGWYQWGVVWTGWSPSNNALYVAARSFDEEHVVQYPLATEWGGDDFEIMIDADHSGGIYAERRCLEQGTHEIKRECWDSFGSQATMFFTAWPAPVPFAAYTAATWVTQPPWVEGGWRYQDHVILDQLTEYEQRWIEQLRGIGWEYLKPSEFTETLSQWNVTTFEVKITPFDRISWEGPDQSIIHTLKEGGIIGLNYAFTDGFYSTSSGHSLAFSYRVLSGIEGPWWDASSFSDFLLAPVDWSVFESTIVQNTTWGRIKASFELEH